MSRNRVERRLSDIGARLRSLRDEQRIGNEQLEQVAGEADDARLRALVSESPLAEREHRDARRTADSLSRQLAGVKEEIVKLEAQQDDLLDRLVADGRRS